MSKKGVNGGLKRGRKTLNEFKEFALKGNIIDLAVGVIIGGAFQSIVNSMVKDIIMPLIGLIVGDMDYSNLFVVLGKVPDGVDVAALSTPAAANAAGVQVFAYGSFISAAVNFLIMAVVIFMLVKGINSMKRLATRDAEKPEPTTKDCPYCRSKVDIKAVRCPHCTSELEVPAEKSAEEETVEVSVEALTDA